jgi:hypothetical protein
MNRPPNLEIAEREGAIRLLEEAVIERGFLNQILGEHGLADKLKKLETDR